MFRENGFAAVSILVFMIMELSGCSGNEEAGGAPQRPGMPIPEVNVVTAVARTVPVQYQFPAQIAGSREVEIRARVSGIIKKRNFTEGGKVKAGDTLFVLDDAQYVAARARTQADVVAAEARLSQARKNEQRMRGMLMSNAVARRDFDDAVSAVAVAMAEVKAAQARRREAALNVDYAKVTAPVSGIAGREQKSEGSYVRGPEELLTTVTQIEPVYVWFGIPDIESVRFRRQVADGRLRLPADRRLTAALTLADGSAYDTQGKLTFDDIRVNPGTGSSEARAVIANPQGILRPGQFVRVYLKDTLKVDAIVIPQRAVLEGPQGKMVMTVDADDKVVAKSVGVGEWVLWEGQEGWVIDSGLQAGERVITDGVMQARPGTQVKPVTNNPAAESEGAKS